MTIITMTDCPPALRGDLSKWLMEVNTGVYVGQISARVRDALWERVTAHIRDGRATMIFQAQNEQHMDFRIHNTSWEIVDFDGLKLVRRPSEQYRKRKESTDEYVLPDGFSKAAKYEKARFFQRVKSTEKTGSKGQNGLSNYTIVDLETTGLKADEDEIIEIGAIRVRGLELTETFHAFVHSNHVLPESIIELTGITDQQLLHGLTPQDAVKELLEFIKDDTLLFHNASFDLSFLNKILHQNGQPMIANPILDTCKIARKKFLPVPDYRLSTLAEHFSISQQARHRALEDCRTTHEIYCKLMQSE